MIDRSPERLLYDLRNAVSTVILNLTAGARAVEMDICVKNGEPQSMTTTEKILAELRILPEAQVREVLDFAILLKFLGPRNKPVHQDASAFDHFGAVYEGDFTRDELYDRN